MTCWTAPLEVEPVLQQLHQGIAGPPTPARRMYVWGCQREATRRSGQQALAGCAAPALPPDAPPNAMLHAGNVPAALGEGHPGKEHSAAPLEGACERATSGHVHTTWARRLLLSSAFAWAFSLNDVPAGEQPSACSPVGWHRHAHLNRPLPAAALQVLVDAAAYLPTHPLNLTETPADAVDISFYKVRQIAFNLVLLCLGTLNFWRCSPDRACAVLTAALPAYHPCPMCSCLGIPRALGPWWPAGRTFERPGKDAGCDSPMLCHSAMELPVIVV